MTLRHQHNGIALRERPLTFSTIAAAESALRTVILSGTVLVGADVVVARNTGDVSRFVKAGYVATLTVEGRMVVA